MRGFNRRIKKLEEKLMVGEFDYPWWWELMIELDPEGRDEMEVRLRKHRVDSGLLLQEWLGKLPAETLTQMIEDLRAITSSQRKSEEETTASSESITIGNSRAT